MKEAFPGKGKWPLEEMSWTLFDEGYYRCCKCVGGVEEDVLLFFFLLRINGVARKYLRKCVEGYSSLGLMRLLVSETKCGSFQRLCWRCVSFACAWER